jgi:Arc/MetJ-type ribon-helix-helix transcriptional regulator
MKVSINLPSEDYEYLEQAVTKGEFASRSAAVSAAVRLLRDYSLEDLYAEDFQTWADSQDAPLWEGTNGDGSQGVSGEKH